METEIKEIKQDIRDHTKEQRHDFDIVFKKLDNLGKSFAGKWVEKVSIAALAGIIIGVMVFVITNVK